MTYGDIYTKFLIEYDKENITSSYPSLTPYEIATILDKAYLALIAQKVTGNNPRRAAFEADTKAIEDLRPLITLSGWLNKNEDASVIKDLSNVLPYDLDETIPDFLYYVSGIIQKMRPSIGGSDPITLISHSDAQKFIYSSANRPWIKTPVAYLEGKRLFVIVDPFNYEDGHEANTQLATGAYERVTVRYIRRPLSFVADGETGPENPKLQKDEVRFNLTEFELNDSMAEELIHLALVMALETTQSPQINTTIQTRALES